MSGFIAPSIKINKLLNGVKQQNVISSSDSFSSDAPCDQVCRGAQNACIHHRELKIYERAKEVGRVFPPQVIVLISKINKRYEYIYETIRVLYVCRVGVYGKKKYSYTLCVFLVTP